MSSEHLSTKEIQAYVQFNVNDDENERVIAHLSECETCLALVDAIWQENTPPDPNLYATKMEKRLMSSIHRSNLGGNLVVLGFGGFFSVVLGVLAPLLNPRPKRRSRSKKLRRDDGY